MPPVSMPSSDVGRPTIPPPGRNMLALHLERALQRLLLDLRQEQGDEAVESVRTYLENVVERAATPPGDIVETLRRMREQGKDVISVPTNGLTEDVRSTKTALQSIQRLQRSVVSSTLSYLSAGGSAAFEVERMFEVLSSAEGELVDRWIDGEQDRRQELLAQVFHDFRSPLTSVFFLTDALYGGLSGSLTETQRHQIGLIFSASLSLMNLVDNVLSSRNLESGELKPECVPFSVSAVMEEVERITGPLAEQTRLALRFERQCRAARMGDPDVMRRILLNLVANAISYTDEGGVHVVVQEEEDDIVIRVEDTGPGIGPEKLEYLFKSFRPAVDDSRSGEKRFSGAGLGLSICHRLAKLVGGDIWVESEPDRGSCFGVRLPFAPLEGAR